VRDVRLDRRLADVQLLSDRAVVYLNGRPLYRGDDTYRSRDYRFLGSIGWYDALYLPLEAGENELVIAVSEDLGGWACRRGSAEPRLLSVRLGLSRRGSSPSAPRTRRP
jgi:hypothetical protein